MAIPDRARFPAGCPELEWVLTDDGSRTLRHRVLDETFHSGCGALSETLVVYLDHSGVAERLHTGRATRVLEYGLGTCTALLLTAALAEACRVPLVYTALELHLVSGDLVRGLGLVERVQQAELGECWPKAVPTWLTDHCFDALAPLQADLAHWLDQLPPWPPGPLPRITSCQLGLQTTLELWQGDAQGFPTQQKVDQDREPVDAVYFDPFSPESCPELWTPAVYSTAFQALRPGGILVSYCVKGTVRREIGSVGFQTERLAGPAGGKREVLRAVRPQ
ncbi:tRNA (5-methylaminomethyl-2-thiouridine)(34)-methyltransferase MnmD [Aureliella helgolandensis]|uniref:tRNA 5-methylaminomethyl-2-thiouridine biosynthesis bifunctional protein MnmC n=1 Tax=Aureliella helgolandensis TaxID=2527968 RepID=A0A518G5Q7_9BACT|nr:MnmC family methyltransferase [Aureliella helgolandensis]QDV23927.1 tRNA 5-methylaminomethyl-2-thiouridine biosynthesis bifunctional protein MnmC [Aureliella helgolandensis]